MFSRLLRPCQSGLSSITSTEPAILMSRRLELKGSELSLRCAQMAAHAALVLHCASPTASGHVMPCRAEISWALFPLIGLGPLRLRRGGFFSLRRCAAHGSAVR